MSEINFKEIELSLALHIIQKYVINKSEIEIKAIEALALYEKIKQKQIKYQKIIKKKQELYTNDIIRNIRMTSDLKLNADYKQNDVIKK